MHNIPTTAQKRICWAGLTALGGLAVVAVGTLGLYVIVRLMGFLQPVLLPLAVAVILAYLLEPVVAFLCRKGCSRTVGTLIVFLAFFLAAGGVLLSVVPTAYRQGTMLVRMMPTYLEQASEMTARTIESLQRYSNPIKEIEEIPADLHEQTEPGGAAAPIPSPAAAGGLETEGTEAVGTEVDTRRLFDWSSLPTEAWLNDGIDWVQGRVPDLLLALGRLAQRSLGGFLGVFGLIVGFVLVPVFLFYLLRDAPKIKETWAQFLPLPNSPLKTEAASLIAEINSYIIAFFRGQVLVAVIDGVIIAVALLFLQLEYAVLIGLMVATIGIIPYAGTILTWGPATLIAAAQFGDWLHPLVVTLIFVGVNQLDSLFITPYVVGESVGLHSLTVMIAVLLWTVVIGGLLGALLAVPLTAALKVLARRYLWERGKRAVGMTAAPG